MTEMTNDSMGKHTGIGEVQIANEVVASIAGISASEVEGVDSMAGGLAGELAGKFGAKNLSKGVKVEVADDIAMVELTGLTVKQVNVRIAGVSLEQD